MSLRLSILAPGLFALSTAITIHLANSAEPLRCGAFATGDLTHPTAQTDPEAVDRMQEINREIGARAYTIAFFGDSLTRKWDRLLWDQHFARLGALNAGVNGDRTEHALWRVEHANFLPPVPAVMVLLIGTNDIGRNRPAPIVAEGVRTILSSLRKRFPDSRILLLGILPRGQQPGSERRHQVADVNRLLQSCADEQIVFYAEVGEVLLDTGGRLTHDVSPDGVHLSERGYTLLTGRVEQELSRVLPHNSISATAGKSR